jgi:ribonuclease P protein component
MRRLRTRDQFQALLAHRPVSNTAHFALHRLRLEPPGNDAATEPPAAFQPADQAWLGALVPKRWARRAVTRNAIRRQIYAVSASLEPPLSRGAHLVRLRAAFALKAFPSAVSPALKAAVRAELQQLFSRLERA